MRFETCENGHFYDSEKYDACPYCGKNLEYDMELHEELNLFLESVLREANPSAIFTIKEKQKYVIKAVDISDPISEHMAENEYRIARMFEDNEHFLKYYAMYKHGGKAYFVQPGYKNLSEYIKSNKQNPSGLFSILEDVMEAVVILQSKNLIHLDINPASIFVDDEGNAMLGNFSLSRKVEEYQKNPSLIGVPVYEAPEICRQTGYSGKEDMYSLGVTMHYVFSDLYEDIYDSVEFKIFRADFFYNVHKRIQEIVQKATVADPNDRFESMEEMLSVFRCIKQGFEDGVLSYNLSCSQMDSELIYAQKSRKTDYMIGYEMSPKEQDTETKSKETDQVFIPNQGLRSRCACGAVLEPGAKFCRFCGSRVNFDKSIDNAQAPSANSSYRGKESIGYAQAPSANRSCREKKSFNNIQEWNASSSCAQMKEISDASRLEISKVHFSAIAPKKLIKGEYSLIDIVMYEDAYRSVVDDLIKNAETSVKETKSGTIKVKERAKVKIQLSSPDIVIDDDIEVQEWQKEYLIFNFSIMLPEKYTKRQVLFTATVYIDDVIATRLKFIAKCWSFRQQKIKVAQEDVLSAFVSYASQDRDCVIRIIQGMQKIRPDMDIFFDVESLRSGELWEKVIPSEIDWRDTLFLCWSHNAKKSEWVDKEWRYAFDTKGAEAIEPIPLESPKNCPPPEELGKKHFNDSLLYIIEAEDGNGISQSDVLSDDERL